MKTLFKVLEKLTENKINFCFQSQGTNNYYNLAVTDPNGRKQYINADNVEHMQKCIKVIWGHVLDKDYKPASVKRKVLPKPPMPLPGM